jgi:hypothetical protein
VRQEYASRRTEGLLVTSRSYSEHQTARRLLTADEVRRLGQDELLIVSGNRKADQGGALVLGATAGAAPGDGAGAGQSRAMTDRWLTGLDAAGGPGGSRNKRATGLARCFQRATDEQHRIAGVGVEDLIGHVRHDDALLVARRQRRAPNVERPCERRQAEQPVVRRSRARVQPGMHRAGGQELHIGDRRLPSLSEEGFHVLPIEGGNRRKPQERGYTEQPHRWPRST